MKFTIEFNEIDVWDNESIEEAIKRQSETTVTNWVIKRLKDELALRRNEIEKIIKTVSTEKLNEVVKQLRK